MGRLEVVRGKLVAIACVYLFYDVIPNLIGENW